jgi:hypothetical protein
VTARKNHPTVILVRTRLLLQKRNKNQVFYLCTKLMERKGTMILMVLYTWTILMGMKMMMMTKKTTKVNK